LNAFEILVGYWTKDPVPLDESLVTASPVTTSLQRIARSRAARPRRRSGSGAGAGPPPALSQRVLAWLDVISVAAGVVLKVVGVIVVVCAAIRGELSPEHLPELCRQLARALGG
jgi:hypothetical protein